MTVKLLLLMDFFLDIEPPAHEARGSHQSIQQTLTNDLKYLPLLLLTFDLEYIYFCSLEGSGRRHPGTSLVLEYAAGILAKPSAVVGDESMHSRAAVF